MWYEFHLGIHSCLSVPTHEICDSVAGSDILWVIRLILVLELGDPVLWSQISGNAYESNEECRSSMCFGCVQYLAAHPKDFSWGKHSINLLIGMWFWHLGL